MLMYDPEAPGLYGNEYALRRGTNLSLLETLRATDRQVYFVRFPSVSFWWEDFWQTS